MSAPTQTHARARAPSRTADADADATASLSTVRATSEAVGTATATATAASASAKPKPSCAEPACASKSSAMRRAMGGAASSSSSNSTSASASTATADESRPRGARAGPPDREELGWATWTLLHTMAAYYPDRPTDAQARSADSCVRGLADLYPCADCAEGFREFVRSHPPRVSTRRDFVVWVCELHNDVNEKLGKDAVPCDVDKLDRAWRGESHA